MTNMDTSAKLREILNMVQSVTGADNDVEAAILDTIEDRLETMLRELDGTYRG